MEIFALLGEWDSEGSMLLGVYASEDDARAAIVTNRFIDRYYIDHYYIERQVVGAPIDHNTSRTYI